MVCMYVHRAVSPKKGRTRRGKTVCASVQVYAQRYHRERRTTGSSVIEATQTSCESGSYCSVSSVQ